MLKLSSVQCDHAGLEPSIQTDSMTDICLSRKICLFMTPVVVIPAGVGLDTVEFLRALGSQSGVSVWQYTLVG